MVADGLIRTLGGRRYVGMPLVKANSKGDTLSMQTVFMC